jgi:hypothetical protein
MVLFSSPRTRAALRDFLYGGKEQLDMKRVEEIIAGFQSFREVMAPAENDKRPVQKSKGLDPTTKEALKLIFASEGSYIQELLLTEVRRFLVLVKDFVSLYLILGRVINSTQCTSWRSPIFVSPVLFTD